MLARGGSKYIVDLIIASRLVVDTKTVAISFFGFDY